MLAGVHCCSILASKHWLELTQSKALHCSLHGSCTMKKLQCCCMVCKDTARLQAVATEHKSKNSMQELLAMSVQFSHGCGFFASHNGIDWALSSWGSAPAGCNPHWLWFWLRRAAAALWHSDNSGWNGAAGAAGFAQEGHQLGPINEVTSKLMGWHWGLCLAVTAVAGTGRRGLQVFPNQQVSSSSLQTEGLHKHNERGAPMRPNWWSN